MCALRRFLIRFAQLPAQTWLECMSGRPPELQPRQAATAPPDTGQMCRDAVMPDTQAGPGQEERASAGRDSTPESSGHEPGLTADEPRQAARPAPGAIHHIELWVPNLDRAIRSWGWLLTALGYRMFQDWPGGRSWLAGSAYIVVEQSPARTASRHDRCRPGLNHLAFHVASPQEVEELTAEALLHGWQLMFSEQHPHAGGPQHYAAYLENYDGFEVELVAD
jgi:catechol 2,3-dioxygenase-like lactoylglutathione lyase family enzyme